MDAELGGFPQFSEFRGCVDMITTGAKPLRIIIGENNYSAFWACYLRPGRQCKIAMIAFKKRLATMSANTRLGFHPSLDSIGGYYEPVGILPTPWALHQMVVISFDDCSALWTSRPKFSHNLVSRAYAAQLFFNLDKCPHNAVDGHNYGHYTTADKSPAAASTPVTNST